MTLKDTISAVEKFHDSFGISNNYEPTTELSVADIELRHRLMQEENDEYMEAAKNGDLVEVADTYEAVRDEGHNIGGDETLLVHPLSTVAPVLNYDTKHRFRLG